VNNSKLSDWLQVAANVGIVIGLLLVGVQLKQTSDLMRTQVLFEESKRATDLETLIVGEDGARVWAKSITNAEDLSLDEQRIMEALLWSYTEQLRATYKLSELGLLESEDWRARVVSDATFYLNNNYGIAWWTNLKSGNDALPEELIAEVDKSLSQSRRTSVDYFEDIRELLTASKIRGN
jgi:hypothetical protein